MALIIQFGLYLLLMPGIGYYSMKKTRNNEDFIIASAAIVLVSMITGKPGEATLQKFDESQRI